MGVNSRQATEPLPPNQFSGVTQSIGPDWEASCLPSGSMKIFDNNDFLSSYTSARCRGGLWQKASRRSMLAPLIDWPFHFGERSWSNEWNFVSNFVGIEIGTVVLCTPETMQFCFNQDS